MKRYIEIADNTRLTLTYLITDIFDDTKIGLDICVLQKMYPDMFNGLDTYIYIFNAITL